ncbi:MAG: hypothetical protein HYX92_14850 [Chloroflexi bacterium]|nr:hypothetical protein [Chloroflexota bacterium]
MRWRRAKGLRLSSFRCLAILASLMALLSPSGPPALDSDSHGDFNSSPLESFLDSANSWVALPGQQLLAQRDSHGIGPSLPSSHLYLLSHESEVYPVGAPGPLGERLLEVQQE